jgi:hypothetical protein
MREYDPEVERTLDPRVGAVYSIVDVATGSKKIVTPSNLTATTPWPQSGGVPTVWSDEYGMTMFIRELGSNQVVVWQGKETLEEVQRTPPVIASGDAFVDGHYTLVELTDDGVMLAYDWETGRLEESSRLAELGAEVAKVIEAPPKRPVRMAVAKDIAVFKWDNYSVYAVITADGSRRDIQITRDDDEPTSIPELVVDETTPFSRWNELTDEEKEAAVRELLLPDLRAEGKDLPLERASSLSSIVPIDNSHVGIEDTLFQRIIAIGPPE